MQLIFRPAELTDLEAIVELLSNDPLGTKREDFRTPLPSPYQAAFKNIMADPNQELTMVEKENKVIGTFQLSFLQYITYQGGIRAQLEGVRVLESQRGQGIGGKIIEHCIKRSKARNAHVLQLTSDKKRPDAIKFYESYGFIASHEGFKLHF